MAEIHFSKDAVWTHISSSEVQADSHGFIKTKMGTDPVSTRKALLFVHSASSGVEVNATILLISPSLPDPTKIQAMTAAMQKKIPIAFKLTHVSFYSTVLVLGDDFSDQALAKVQNSDTRVKKVTINTLAELL